MKRVSVVFALAVLACSARSEPRAAEPVMPPSFAPVDAVVGADATDVVPADARKDLPTSPRTTFPVVAIEANRDGARVTIGIGKRQGVGPTWKFHLVNSEGRAVAGGQLTNTVVRDFSTWAMTKLSPGQIPAGANAYLESY